MNADETQMPQWHSEKVVNSGETIAPKNLEQFSENIVLLSGEVIADEYVVNSLLDKQGQQATIYLVKKWGKSYVLKMYKQGWKASTQMQYFLANVRHPGIANIVQCGDYKDSYYEIYDYYPEGTMEDAKALSVTHIQNIIVPSINEGLHELHKNGIVHCDIKPGNLFYADNKSRVVIGDCGISGYANASGKLIDTVRGTPEYAPRVKALLWSAALSPAYDYGSLGLVLCRAVLGRSLFEGMSVEEIAAAWDMGIELPSQISGRVGGLIRGLLTEDESQRWGYIEVKRWCEGEYMRPTNRCIYTGTKKIQEKKPLIFGKFGDQTVKVSSLHQLELAIKEHWDQATKIVKRRELVEFVRQYDISMEEKVRELSYCQDPDVAVFKLLCYIMDGCEEICFKGKIYRSMVDYAESLSLGRDDVANKFLFSGMLVFYLRHCQYEPSRIDQLERLIKKNDQVDMSSIATICAAMQGKKSIKVLGEMVDSLDGLVLVLSKHTTRDIDQLLETDEFVAWMNRLGYSKEMNILKEGL